MKKLMKKIWIVTKKVLTFLKDVLFGYKGTAIYCPYCHSYKVHPITDSKIQSDGQWHETYKLECGKCHSIADMTEIWDKQSSYKKRNI